MSGWQTVLDDKLDLLRFWESPVGAMAARGFGESMVRVAKDEGGDELVAAEDHFVRYLQEIEALKCRECDPVYVADEMMDLVEFAAETFEPEPLVETDFVTRAGFLVLPRPLFMRDRHNRSCAFRVVSWYPTVWGKEGEWDGVHLSFYAHADDPDDYMPTEAEVEAQKLFSTLARTPYQLTHVTGWRIGEEVPRAVESGDVDIRTGGWWVPVQALFRLMMQTVSERTHEEAPRPARKRWQREQKQERAPGVTVVRLRRPRTQRDDGTHKEVPWSSRWLVSGHWRDQWFPSLKMHRQIWISPYVKGPENQPLVVRKAHAYEFVK